MKENEMSEGEQRSCGYEQCQKPLEVKAGHRRGK
jgi:hypothetical protein